MMTNLLKRLPIKRKLVLLTLLTSSVALLFAATVFTVYQLSAFRNELVREVGMLAEIVAGQSRLALAQDDRRAVEQVLSTLRREANIVTAAVRSGDGRTLAVYSREGHDADFGPVEAGGPLFLDRYLVLQRPVLEAGREVGSVYLKTDLQGLYRRITQESLIGALVMLASFFVAFLLSTRVQRAIAGPIQNLVDAARGAAQDRLPRVAPGAEQGDELGVLVGTFNQMVEEIQRRDAALARSERHFRSLIENASDIITVVDAAGMIVYQSPAVHRVLGFDPADVEGRSIFHFVHPDDAQDVRDRFDRCLAHSGSPVTVECRVRHHDGRWRFLEAVGNNLLDDPAVGGVVINARDISEREETVRELSHSRERFRRLVDHAADAFFLHDLYGNIIDVNERACTTLGYTREELLKLRIKDIELNYVEADIPGTWAGMDTSHVVTIQGVHRRKDGSTFPVEVRVGLFESSGRKLMLALARDMTERERAARELKAAKEAAEAATLAKSQFLANMSHEIRTPMTAVIGMTELLQRTALAADQTHYVEIIRNSGDALLSVIDDILDISQIESGKLTLDCLDFSPVSVVEGVLDLLAQRAQIKGIELAGLVEPDVPLGLRGDPGRLRQVLINLLGNAVKFTEHGEVHLRVSLQESGAREVLLNFTVRDTGIGIPEGLKCQLFEPFVQADSSAKRRHGGTGLGLAICKSLVDMMQGEIGAVSEPDGGSTFWFTARFEKTGNSGRIREGNDILRGKRLLVVDDNRTARELVQVLAESRGMQVVQASSGVEAVERLREAARDGTAPDVAVVDARMPGIDGLTLLRTAGREGLLGHCRVVLLTALGEGLDQAQCAELSVSAQCAKPLKQSQFCRKIAGLLDATAQPPVAAAAAAVPSAAARTSPRLGLRVLLAEDNLVNQEVLTLMLERLGCSVVGVGDGFQALEALARGRFDVVLMDCQMPGMDGYETTVRIRAKEGENGAARMPVIAMTANALAGDRERCLAAGMDAYLAKPVTEEKLMSALSGWGVAEQESQSREDPVLDPQVWNELRRTQAAGNPNFIRRLVDLFTDDTPKRIARIRALMAAGDPGALAREAHALRGSCRLVGAQALNELTNTLEQHGRAGELAGAEPLVDALEDAYEAVRDALRRESEGL